MLVEKGAEVLDRKEATAAEYKGELSTMCSGKANHVAIELTDFVARKMKYLNNEDLEFQVRIQNDGETKLY